MQTVNDITSRCPVSEKPSYVVFERFVPNPLMRDNAPFWRTLAVIPEAQAALDWANGGDDQNGNSLETFVCAMSDQEARNIRRNHLTFTDAEVAIYRSPYATAAE